MAAGAALGGAGGGGGLRDSRIADDALRRGRIPRARGAGDVHRGVRARGGGAAAVAAADAVLVLAGVCFGCAALLKPTALIYWPAMLIAMRREEPPLRPSPPLLKERGDSIFDADQVSARRDVETVARRVAARAGLDGRWHRGARASRHRVAVERRRARSMRGSLSSTTTAPMSALARRCGSSRIGSSTRCGG